MPFDLETDIDLDDREPYDSVSDREPLQSVDSLALGSVRQTPSVKNVIADRKGMTLRDEPLLQNFEKQQGELDQYRNQQADMNRAANLAQIASQAARGASSPEPQNDLYKNIAAQSKDLLKSKEEDLDRRQKIVNAIETRKSREAIAAQNRDLKEAIIQANAGQKDKTRNIQANRLVAQTEKELRDDPIAKPSEMNLASLQKSNMTLNNKSLPLTPNVLADAEQDIASALQLRGMGATEGKIDRTKLYNLQRTFAEAKQKFGNSIVDLRKEAPELVDQIRAMNQSLIDDYKTTIAQRKHSILDDREAIFGDDPTFASKMQALRGSVSKRFGPPPSDSGGGIIPSAHAAGEGKVVKKLYSPSRNQTKIIYDDGNEVIVNGQQ